MNALFDAVSYAITLAFAQFGLRRHALFWGLLDFGAAMLLFLGLGAVLVSIVAWMNRVAGIDFVDLGGLLAEAGNWREYWWLYAMLFSTALPTFLHLLTAFLSVQVCARPGVRARIVDSIEGTAGGDVARGFAASGMLGLLWFVAFALPFFLIVMVVYAAWSIAGAAWAEAYRDWLVEVAIRVGGI